MKVFQHKQTGRWMDNHGFTVKQCGKCQGQGYLPGYEFSDGARCWRCNRKGWYRTPKVQAVRDAFAHECRKSQQAGGEAPSIFPYWEQAGIKVEEDIKDLFT